MFFIFVIKNFTFIKSAMIGESGCPRFAQWVVTHSATYATLALAKRAKSAYATNCARYERLNSVEGGARFGADAFSDLTLEEFSHRFGGWMGGAAEQKAAALAAGAVATAHAVAAAAPPAVDWRTKGQVTPVKNQGAFGTCWSFAVAENFEGLGVRQGHPLTNVSEQEFIDCCATCQGASADKSFEWLSNQTSLDGHPALESSYVYVGKPGKCLSSTSPAAKAQLHAFGRVSDDGTGVPIASALAVKGPMGMGVDATCFAGYKGGVIKSCTSKGIDHAVLMVASGEEKGTSYFTIKNSWGGKWGESGYVRIEQGQTWWGNISTIWTN